MKNNEEILKYKLCDKLIKEGKVHEGDIVKHSYTQQILDDKKKSVEKENEMITLTTRGDCVDVCVKQYLGVYDHKESDTFRPTIDKRIHLGYPVSKTITTREDSCAVMEQHYERERVNVSCESANLHHLNVLNLWVLQRVIIKL